MISNGRSLNFMTSFKSTVAAKKLTLDSLHLRKILKQLGFSASLEKQLHDRVHPG